MTEDAQDSSSSEQQQPQIWDASQYEAALAQLERLQEQLDNVRSTIPSIVAPLTVPGTSKAQMFAGVRKSAVQSTNNLRAFREKWDSEQTRELLAISKESLEKNDDLTKAGDVAKYGWSQQQ